MIILSDLDIERLLPMKEAVEVVEDAFRKLYEGKAKMPLRIQVNIERYKGVLLLMPAYIDEMDALATKVVSFYPENPRLGLPTIVAHVVVCDPRTGRVIAILEANRLTAIRTGAVSGVATKHLAREDAEILAIIGCGVQGRTQAMGVCAVRPIKEIWAYDIVYERAERYAREMSDKLGLPVKVAASAEEAARKADVICTATTSKTPVVKRGWLKVGVHINAIGAFRPDMQELDGQVIAEAKVVVDQREAALAEAGDVIIPIKQGLITEEHIYAELGEVVSGAKPGRTSDEEITVFKSVGLAIQDASTANYVVRKFLSELRR